MRDCTHRGAFELFTRKWGQAAVVLWLNYGQMKAAVMGKNRNPML